jgi:O-antigen/teichoic acid export membrane protein
VFNLGVTLERKTWLAFISLLFSALLNVGVNIVLIPLYGATGAAIATLVAYIAFALVSYLFNQCIYPVPFEVGLFLVASGIGIMLYFADSSLVQGQSDVITLCIHIGLLMLYGGTLTVLGWLPSRIKIKSTTKEDFA